MRFSTPKRNLPYLGKQTFDEMFFTVFLTFTILLYVAGNFDAAPSWLEMAIKVVTGFVVFADVVIRKITFSLEVKDGKLSYFCRGILNSKSNVVGLSDISNVESIRSWHYRLLGLSSFKVFTLGSQKAVISSLVLSKKDGDEFYKLFSENGDEELQLELGKVRNDTPKLTLSKLRIIITPFLMPWKRQVGMVNIYIFMISLIFLVGLYQTDGDVIASVEKASPTQDLNILTKLAEVKLGGITEQFSFFESLSLMVCAFFILLITVGRLFVFSFTKLNTSIRKEGDYLFIEAGLFDLNETKRDIRHLSSYSLDINFLYKVTGLTTLTLYNRDDGSEWESPLITMAEAGQIIEWSRLPEFKKENIEGVALRTLPFRLSMSAFILFELLALLFLGYLCLPAIDAYPDVVGGFRGSPNEFISNGWLVALAPALLFFIVTMQKMMSYLVSTVGEINGVVYAKHWDCTSRVSVFHEKESYCSLDREIVGLSVKSYFAGKKEYFNYS